MKMTPPANNESEVDRNDFYCRQQISFQVSSALHLAESNCGLDNPGDSVQGQNFIVVCRCLSFNTTLVFHSRVHLDALT